MSRPDYDQTKRLLQIELLKLQHRVSEAGQRMVIVFEGRDAAGKGGTIKPFIEHLDPRGARVVALGKPTEREESEWYFQRDVHQRMPSTWVWSIRMAGSAAGARAHGGSETDELLVAVLGTLAVAVGIVGEASHHDNPGGLVRGVHHPRSEAGPRHSDTDVQGAAPGPAGRISRRSLSMSQPLLGDLRLTAVSSRGELTRIGSQAHGQSSGVRVILARITGPRRSARLVVRGPLSVWCVFGRRVVRRPGC
jgi:Polyphosphate kinase 2 (PPK2)